MHLQVNGMQMVAGGMVKKDQAYVELEAMKMIMPLKARGKLFM